MASAAWRAHADWTLPVPIHYGPGRLAELGEVCARNIVKRPLLVTDRQSVALPFFGRAAEILRSAGCVPVLFTEIDPNPTDRNVAAGVEAFRRQDCDGVVAIGGGSGMDGGKAIALAARLGVERFGDLDLVGPAPLPLAREDFVPVICVPTTAGTGAETESTAMLTDTRRLVKICIWHPAARPRAAILDPELTLGLPPDLTAWTGCDALVHALEAFLVPTLHPICDGIALQAMGIIHRALPRAYGDGTDLEARGAMMVGACLAGISFLKGLGLVHSISHMVGAVYGSHHGRTNAVLLPAVLRFNRAALPASKLADVARTFGLDDPGFEALYDAMTAFFDDLGIPRSLAALGVEPGRTRELAEKAMADACTPTSPIVPEVEQLEALIAEAIEQAW